MKIYLVGHTTNPLKSIAIPMMNMGIGKAISNPDDISDADAEGYFNEVIKSYLPEPMTFTSFNFLWKDVPIFMLRQLIRSHIGWSFAERSLRFWDPNLKEPVEEYDWKAMPIIASKNSNQEAPFQGIPLKEIVSKEMLRQMELYKLLVENGSDQQDARNILGVWFPTDIQTTCTYYALRHLISKRLSSQAHEMWQDAAKQIKALVTEVSKPLGDALVTACEIENRCVWRSRLDRDCKECIERGMAKKHEHEYTETTSWGIESQCKCGVLRPAKELKEKNG
jgi:flavin-dependent thymidylate synthase